ncbi:hypothetical protein [Acetobacter sp. P1H12_c]|uniref:hypothetical protein n=1 Tax=Acetobacter sp. P1H12_c TaxID=2762621 RepID=UPI001C03DB66|nr:hypothetical protein [Acetobacter sp. P1H12_c]
MLRNTFTRRKIFGFGFAGLVCSGMWILPSRSQAAPRKGNDPWACWNSLPDSEAFPDPRILAIAFGILAPNAQNLQPWRARLVGDDTVLLYADLSRRLPATDPIDRQITVSFGTFCELFRLGARVGGYETEIIPFPDGASEQELDSRPVAQLKLTTPSKRAPEGLVDHVLQRSTNRLPFDLTRHVTQRDITKLTVGGLRLASIHGTAYLAEASRIRTVARQAYRAAMSDDAACRELFNVTRIGRAETTSYRWGPAIVTSEAEQYASDGEALRLAFLTPKSKVLQDLVSRYLAALDTGRAYMWVVTADNSRVSMFNAGREWAHLHLAVTAMGLKLQPHSQSLQDFPAIEPMKKEIHALLAAQGTERIQMLGRIGYAVQAPHSPREPVSLHLVS